MERAEDMDQPINPYQEILNLLQKGEVTYRVIKHEPVYTSQQAEEVSGLSLSQGAKVILLFAETQFALAVLPGDRKVDTKKVANYLGIKKVRFASEEEVKTVMHCDVGACYPFGSFLGVRTIADPLLQQEEIIAFNPGVNDQSIIMSGSDYFKIAKPEIQSVVRDNK